MSQFQRLNMAVPVAFPPPCTHPYLPMLNNFYEWHAIYTLINTYSATITWRSGQYGYIHVSRLCLPPLAGQHESTERSQIAGNSSPTRQD